MTRGRRYSWSASIAAIVPCLLAGIVLGGFLRTPWVDGVALPAPTLPEQLPDRTAIGAAPGAPAAGAAPTDAPKAAEARGVARTLPVRLRDYAAALRKAAAICKEEKV